MIRVVVSVALVLALAACGRPGRHADAAAPVAAPAGPDQSAGSEYLAAHPAILADVHRRCKARMMDVTPDLCAAAAEATRLRFLAPSGAYAPQPVQPFAEGANHP
jgi:hypothetical protein